MAKARPRPEEIVVKSSLGEWQDYAATREYLTKGLTEDELELLHRSFTSSADNQRIFELWSGLGLRHGKDREKWAFVREIAENAWRQWLERILHYDVEIKAGGRAVVRKPGDDYRIEIQSLFDRKSKQHHAKSIRVVADDFLSFGRYLPSVDEHFAAFQFRARQHPAFARAPRSRPAPGQPADPDFYRRLLDTYDKLAAEGHKSPAIELAERMDVNHSTVKSWLHRGRKYLEEGNRGMD